MTNKSEEPRVVPIVLLVVAMAIGVLVVVLFHIPMPYQVVVPLLAGSAPTLYVLWWRRRHRTKPTPRNSPCES